MVTRITIYGWVLQRDPIHGWGSGSLVDLVYFVSDDNIRVQDIFSIVEHAGYKLVSKKIAGTKIHEADRVTIDDWSSHIKVGAEKMESVSFEQPTGPYDRYNYPYSGGI